MRYENPNYSFWPNPGGPMAFPMQQWAAVMRAWAEVWGAFLPGGGPQQMWGPGCGGYAAPMAPAFSVQVSSLRNGPETVTTNLHMYPGYECVPLTVGALSGERPESPLKGVSIENLPGSLRVSVPVPADQPHGAYHGPVMGPDGRTLGTMTVTLALVVSKD